MRTYDTVLLDADMTLFDFERSEQEALCKVLTARGYDTNTETISLYHTINQSYWEANARGEIDQSSLAVERFSSFMAQKGGCHDPRKFNEDYQIALGESCYLLDGAVRFCQTLKESGFRLAIVTNGLPIAQWGRLNRSSLKGMIPHMFVSMEIGFQKPQPEFFDVVCRALEIHDRSRAVIMGDGLGTDIQGGINAGIDTIWYTPREGRTSPVPVPAPTYTVKSYQEALKILLTDT